MALRAFPVLYAKDVELAARFYAALGLDERFRMAREDGHARYLGMRRDGAELAVTTGDSQMPWGERLAFVADPEGNVVSLARAAE